MRNALIVAAFSFFTLAVLSAYAGQGWQPTPFTQIRCDSSNTLQGGAYVPDSDCAGHTGGGGQDPSPCIKCDNDSGAYYTTDQTKLQEQGVMDPRTVVCGNKQFGICATMGGGTAYCAGPYQSGGECVNITKYRFQDKKYPEDEDPKNP